MCGISGVVGFSGFDPISARKRVAGALARMGHRGPDGVGMRDAAGAVFGAARLVVRGPRGGLQPLVGPGGWLVACNGEIDNHRALRRDLEAKEHEIEGESDVDVLPFLFAEFGRAAVEMIDGPFALAAWNPATRRLILARDRAGEKPLFFHQGEHRVWFASELAAIASDPALELEVDRGAISAFLQRGFFTSPATPVVGVSKVAPGEVVEFGESSLLRARVANWIPRATSGAPPTVESFARAFHAAVRSQAEVDVPYGVFLSGGLDSSLVAASAVRSASAPPRTAFCVRFHESSYDEGERARHVARALGLPLEEVWLGSSELRAIVEDLVVTAGEPLADPAWAPTAALSRLARSSVGMVMCGEGADEVLGGYPTYLGIGLARGFSRLPRPMRIALVATALRMPDSEKKVTLPFLVKRFVRYVDLDPVARHRAWTGFADEAALSSLGLEAPVEPTISGDRLGELSRIQKLDYDGLLSECLMTKSDRAAMRYGLELRCPFLDRHVLELAAEIPESERVRGFETKIFLKKLARTLLPESVVAARKRGLSVPISAWLRTELSDWAGDRLSDSCLHDAGIEPARALALLEAHRRRQADLGRPIWALAVLATWLRWFRERRSTDSG